MIKKFFEHIDKISKDSDDLKYKPIKSFILKDVLNPKIWEKGDVLKDNIRTQLIEIANDLYSNLELNTPLVDIVLTGSLANYNYSEYSDFDLHILFDFEQLNKDTTLVRKYCDAITSNWNSLHDIKIYDYDVEVYLQGIKDEHHSTGQYSLLNNEWLVKPHKENFEPDEELIKLKASNIMDRIDSIEIDFENGEEYETLLEKIKRVFKKVKDGRKAGLSRDGEYSVENLVFKLLRRNGYIGKIIDIRREAYDKKFK